MAPRWLGNTSCHPPFLGFATAAAGPRLSMVKSLLYQHGAGVRRCACTAGTNQAVVSGCIVDDNGALCRDVCCSRADRCSLELPKNGVVAIGQLRLPVQNRWTAA